ncbi:hypothetical protein Q1695_006990 [Nippostrongylus brasiliensis]|nr:hypothetical protein Q1695_006990 [Nippostrongylus brasiliensis]
MWFKSVTPVALAAAAVTYGAASKSGTFNSDISEKKKKIRSDQLESLEAKKSKAREAIERQMVLAGIPGLSIGVSKNGRIIWREGFGYANVESGSRVTGDSIMRIASISKPITAAIAARLVQAGQLNLDASIQTYLPDFPAKKFDGKPATITTRQLLSHNGGIRHYKKGPDVS